MPTNNSWNNTVTAANVSFNGGTFIAGNDATDNAISIGTAANAGRTVTVGNVTGTTAVNVNTGTGGSAITTTNGTFAVATGTGAVNIGTDGVAKTITIGNGTGATSVVLDCGTGALNIGTNAIARTTTIGNTTGASILALKTGTGDFTLASATGTIISALDTGEITYPLQSAFLAYQASNQTNATGKGAIYQLGSTTDLTEVFDQNSDFNPTTGSFVAPVTGRYNLSVSITAAALTAAMTFHQTMIVTSNRTYYFMYCNPGIQKTVAIIGDLFSATGSMLTDMDAADTAVAQIYIDGGVADSATINGGANAATSFGGFLAC